MKHADVKGLIYDIQRQCIHDGDGIRTVLFMKGCPLRCLWCSNPESQLMAPQLAYSAQLCTGCEQCVAACPYGAIKAPGEIDRAACVACDACAQVCYPGALTIKGRWVGVEEICGELLRDLPFFRRSGGGVTVSGGEPFQQAEFVLALLHALHGQGVHTAVETCGVAKKEDLLAAEVDQFLYDIKLLDPEEHRRWTGVSNEIVLSNLDALCKAGRRITLRFPLIPDVNDSEENIRATARLIQHYGIREFHMLPFHQLGSSKYQMIGKPYEMQDKPVPDPQRVQQVMDWLRQEGIEPVLGG